MDRKLRDSISGILNIHSNIASDLITLGGVFHCRVCGYNEIVTEAAIARNLKNGWGKHCNQTMRWITNKQLEGVTDGNV